MAHLGNLCDVFNVLDVGDDNLQRIAREVHANGDLPAFATTNQHIRRLARSRVPVTWTLEDYKSLMGFSQQIAGGGLPFTGCERLRAAAPKGTGCYALQQALRAAAVLSRLTALELSITPSIFGAEDITRSRELRNFSSGAEAALAPLSELQQLRQLKLATITLGTDAASHVATLTSLTSLQLKQNWRSFGCNTPPDLTPFSDMSGLVELQVDGRGVPEPPEEADGPYAVPHSLRRLTLKGDTAYWLQHLAGCPLLEELHLDYEGTSQHASAHPAAVLRLAAEHTPGLIQLTCPFTMGATFTKQLQLLPDAVAEQEVPLPGAAVQALTALQRLDGGCHLVVRDSIHWEALGCLKALTSLQGIIVEGAPPPGWCHSGVQHLGAVLRVPGLEAAAAVLLSFPAARLADLRAVAGGVVLQQLPALGGMGSLEELLVDGSTAPPPTAAAAAGSCGLPSSLLRLQVEGGAAGGWLQHLPAAPRLTELQYEYDSEQHTSTHPAAVLQLSARHTPHLCVLTCQQESTTSNSSNSRGNGGSSGGSSSGSGSSDGGSSSSSSSSYDDSDQEEVYLLQLPPPEQQRPPSGPPLAALTFLRHLSAAHYLCVRSAADWQALGHLTALSSLQGIVVYQAPPQAWQHSRVKQLAVALQGVGGEQAARVLLAFPSLQQAQVSVWRPPSRQQPARGAAASSSQQQGMQRVLSLLSSLQLEYPGSSYEGGMCPAAHAAPILAAARGVNDLVFEGECERQDGPPLLPDLSGVTSVTRLRFGRSQEGDQAAAEEDVVAMVQPLAPTLRVLELSGMRRISPNAATQLQGVLPRLKRLVFSGCEIAGSMQLPRVKAQLRAGIVISESS
jgi:hypothetical protein